ncbi:MAG: hypothetical protein ACN2B6_12485 [Rickettsiales bacterium]
MKPSIGNNTTVTVTALAGAFATLLIWLLGVIYPDVMTKAPIGLEAAFATLFSAAMSMVYGGKNESSL